MQAVGCMIGEPASLLVIDEPSAGQIKGDRARIGSNRRGARAGRSNDAFRPNRCQAAGFFNPETARQSLEGELTFLIIPYLRIPVFAVRP